MELYTLNPDTFLKDKAVDNTSSVIWTERFSTAGEVVITAPATPLMAAILREDTLIAEAQSQEVMVIDTVTVEKGVLKATGSSLLKYLFSNRLFRWTRYASHKSITFADQRPTYTMLRVVQEMAVDGQFMQYKTEPYDPGFDAETQKVTGLTINFEDFFAAASETALANTTVEYGQLYDALVKLATTYIKGQRLFLDSASSSGYVLRYQAYSGRVLTSGQTAFPVVQFSPSMDTLTGVKEIRSSATYKNVAIAYAPTAEADPAMTGYIGPGYAYADGDAAASRNLKRKVIMVVADDITAAMAGNSPANARAILEQKARDALANNNYTRVADGEVVPQSQFLYGRNYKLGDIVELKGFSGIATPARITEYIRTSDNNGERAYPTVSVLA